MNRTPLQKTSFERLQGKVAIVTGASKGIGAAIARAYAREGARVAVNYASCEDDASRVVGEIVQAGGVAVAIKADVSQPEDVAHLFERTIAEFGVLDILVNNAGRYGKLAFTEVTPADFHQQFDVNVLGVVLASQQAIQCFGSKGGCIINIGSVSVRTTPLHSSIYAAAKAAVVTLGRALAIEVGPLGIRVNTIHPGLTATEGSLAGGYLSEQHVERVVSATPLRRIGHPDDIASVALWLASDEAGWLTGEAIFASGGRH